MVKLPLNNDAPFTEKVAAGVEEPTPTLPDGKTVKKPAPLVEATFRIGKVWAEVEA